jgi:hypothetical protein
MTAYALAAFRLIGKVALVAAGILALMLALVDLPDMAVPEPLPRKEEAPVERTSAPNSETAQCSEYQGL